MEINKDSLVANLSSPPEAPVKLKVSAKPGLCLRKAPSTNATVLEVLGTGIAVTATFYTPGEEWICVTTKDGSTGYVKAAFVKEVK